MNRIIFILLAIAISYPLLSQEQPALRKFREFELGMTETDFMAKIKDKYQYTKSLPVSMIMKSSKPPLADEYKPEVKCYHLQNFFARIGEVGFNKANFYFVEGKLFKIYVGLKDAISKNEATSVSNELYKSYSKYKYKGKKLTNSKSEKLKDKFTGHWYFRDQVSSANIENDGLQILFKYSIKKSYSLSTYITLIDYTIMKPWQSIVEVRQEAVKKELKPYERFRKAYLGMHFNKFKEVYPSHLKIENPIRDKKLVIYENCEVFINENEKMELIGVPLKDVWYFFFKNQLIAIGIRFTEKFQEKQKTDFLENIQIVYGNHTKIEDDMYKWISKGKYHEIQLGLAKNNMLFYTDEYLGDILYKEAKEKEKKELQSDF